MYVVLITLLSLVSYWRVFTFTFWKDDWWLLWAATTNISKLTDWLHPGTPVEFMLFAPLFGTRAVLWQLLGFVLHVAIALALARCVSEFTHSRRGAKVSGVLYAVSVAGMDAVGWPAAHVVLWASLFLLIGLTYYVRRNKILAYLYICLALLIDPFRVFPILLIYPYVLVIAIFLFPFFWHNIVGSQLVTHLFSPAYVFQHIYVLGNYFNSIANLFFGWLIPFPEDASTGVYNRLWAIAGLSIVCLSVFAFKRNKKIFLLLFWIFLFYIPNWLFEPRLTMGITHRYMVIPALGVAALFGYALSFIKNYRLYYLLFGLLLLSNIAVANYFAHKAAPYRESAIINALWDRIDADVPEVDNPVFSYSGEDPLKTYGLELSGAYPFAIRRKITEIPIVTEDREYLEKLLCEKNIPINHIFAWNVTSEGVIANESMKVRSEVLTTAMDHGCVPVIDQLLIENK